MVTVEVDSDKNRIYIVLNGQRSAPMDLAYALQIARIWMGRNYDSDEVYFMGVILSRRELQHVTRLCLTERFRS